MQKAFIIIKGVPRGLQIETIKFDGNGVYAVKYESRNTIYHYRRTDVTLLKKAKYLAPESCLVYMAGELNEDVVEIQAFAQGEITHWRITLKNGSKHDFLDGDNIEVRQNCLANERARNVFDYLKSIAKINSLGKDEESFGLLYSLYSNIESIDNTLAIAPYISPKDICIEKTEAPSLVFPFGCNASQKEAVTAAFSNQISVIQGPPGTGKTQTILNIIANILLQGKTVIVVSNNNSATTNVLEKLEKYGMGFLVASLGNKENKEAFLKNMPLIPDGLGAWACDITELPLLQQKQNDALMQLEQVFEQQEKLAKLKLEIQSLKLELEHFLQEYKDEASFIKQPLVSSSAVFMSWWMKCQVMVDKNAAIAGNVFKKTWNAVAWWWMRLRLKRILHVPVIDKRNLWPLITMLQGLYYKARIAEAAQEAEDIERNLKTVNAQELSEELTDYSMRIFKDVLSRKYRNMPSIELLFANGIGSYRKEFCFRFPVVLSTTFSARTSVPKQIYDYLIMDEASQVAIETGALALTCAKNAVIVGDAMQLPNVLTDEGKQKLNAAFSAYTIDMGYNSAENSFLDSVCKILPGVKHTLLREHYRCHPRIINFCNQKYYGGNLLIMKHDQDEENVLSAIKTVKGNHARAHYNQREIDVIRQEVLPKLDNAEDVGIISPYNAQVDAINAQLGDIAATVHKYQGREKDTIIFSVVDDQITSFTDNANLLNVAISRAKKSFHLVVTGNEQHVKGNITDLIEYIEYNNCSVTESKVHSIFDYLYSAYTAERIQWLAKCERVSEYESENLTYALICKILKEHTAFNCFGVLCHYPLYMLIKDPSAMTAEEQTYANHPATHIDFLIYSHVTKKPVLAIETDGYSFHNSKTSQHKRDLMKNNILRKYALSLLRLSTNGSGEEKKIIEALGHN